MEIHNVKMQRSFFFFPIDTYLKQLVMNRIRQQRLFQWIYDDLKVQVLVLFTIAF